MTVVPKGFPRQLANHVIVNRLADLPAPVGDVIQLADNTTYQFSGGNFDFGAYRIQCGLMNRLIGSGGVFTNIQSGISSGAFITSNVAISALEIRDLNFNLIDTNSELFDLSTMQQLIIYNAFFSTNGKCGNWEDIDTVRCNFTSFVGFNEGLHLTGTFGFMGIERCGWINNGITPATDCITTDASTDIQVLQFVGNLVLCPPGTNGFNIDPSTLFVFGDEKYKINLCEFIGGGTYIAGITQNNLSLKAKVNGGIADTNNGMFYRWSAPLPTTPTPGTPVKVAGGTTPSANLNRGFDLPGDNDATMIIDQPATFKVEAILSGTQSLALATDYTLYVAVGGAVVSESAITVRPDTVSGKAVLQTQAVVPLVLNSVVSIYLDATVANDFTVESGTVLITQLY